MKRKHKWVRPVLKVKKASDKVIRTKGGRWKRGHSGNPSGVKGGKRDEMTLGELVSAIRKVEKSKRRPLLEHLVQRAYNSDTALGILLKKLLPDLKAMEALIGNVDGKMSPDVAASIGETLRERFKTPRVSNQKRIQKDNKNKA